MITLSTDVSAAALGVDRKTLDNVLAREGRSLIGIGSRGRRRRIPIGALEAVAVALILNRDMGVSIARGLELAARVLDSRDSSVKTGSLTALVFDLPRLRSALEVSIADALESVAEPSRGRPRS